MNNKSKPMTRQNRRLLISALGMGIGIGGLGSYILTLMQPNHNWMLVVLVLLTLIEGYLIGRIQAVKK